MNKIVSINLGGYPFTIDEDAFEVLTQYLNSIRNHFKGAEGCEEIVADIEARLAELCHESLDGGSILSMDHIKNAIQTMGQPEQFDSPDEGSEEPTRKKQKKTVFGGIKPGKKLFRNMDDKVIGGVCSGLSAYLGIQDPTWIRIIVAIAFFAGGIGFLPYIIFWIVVPEAKTAADKLAMRGEPINVNSIADTIQSEVEKITRSITEFGEEMTEKYGGSGFKKKSKSNDDPSNSSDPENHDTKQAFYQPAYNQDFVHKGMDAARNIFDGFARFFRGAGKTILLIMVSILIFVVATSWVALIVSFGFMYPYESYLLDSPIMAFLALASGLLTIGIPVLGFLFLVLRVVFKTKFRASWGIGLTVLWFFCLFTVIPIAGNLFSDFNQTAMIQSTSPQAWDMLTTDTLNVVHHDDGHAKAMANIGPIELTQGKLYSSEIDLEIVKAEGPNFKLSERRYAQGPSDEMANEYAKNPDFTVVLDNEQLKIDRQFFLKKGEKWRAQHIKLKLEIPVGKSITLDRSVTRNLTNFEAKNSWSHRSVYQKTWTMTEDGFVAPETNLE